MISNALNAQQLRRGTPLEVLTSAGYWQGAAEAVSWGAGAGMADALGNEVDRSSPGYAAGYGGGTIANYGMASGEMVAGIGRAVIESVGAYVAKGAGSGLPGSAFVCRGGACTAERFAGGRGVTLDASGKLQGVSVESAPGLTVRELTQSIPHKQVGVTTVDQIRALGGDVVRSPGTSPYHCTMCGITPAQAEGLFTPTIRNPWVK